MPQEALEALNTADAAMSHAMDILEKGWAAFEDPWSRMSMRLGSRFPEATWPISKANVR